MTLLKGEKLFRRGVKVFRRGVKVFRRGEKLFRRGEKLFLPLVTLLRNIIMITERGEMTLLNG